MLNLLPQENRKSLKREYYFRLLVVVAIFILIISAFSGLFLISSFMISVSRQDVALSAQDQLKKIEAQQASADIKTALIKAKNEMALVGKTDGTGSMLAILTLALSHKVNGDAITGITIDKTNSAGPLITLSGTANDRQSLVAFSNALDAEPLFTSVNIPISDFTQDSNIPFSLSFNLKK